MIVRVCLLASMVAASLFAGSSALRASDWPQWLGPNRDGVLPETGLVEKFPEGGLPAKWRIPVGLGYSGPAVANGKVYLTDYLKESGSTGNDPGTRRTLQGKERILCVSAETGEKVWEHAYSCPYEISYPSGPRATPTVDQDRVYSLGAEGDLILPQCGKKATSSGQRI